MLLNFLGCRASTCLFELFWITPWSLHIGPDNFGGNWSEKLFGEVTFIHHNSPRRLQHLLLRAWLQRRVESRCRSPAPRVEGGGRSWMDAGGEDSPKRPGPVAPRRPVDGGCGFPWGLEGYFRGRDRIWISHDKSVTSVWRHWNSCLGFGGIIMNIMNHSQRFWKINIYHIYPDWIDGLRFTFLGHTPGHERRDGLNRRQQLVFGATWNSNKWLDQQKMRT